MRWCNYWEKTWLKKKREDKIMMLEGWSRRELELGVSQGRSHSRATMNRLKEKVHYLGMEPGDLFLPVLSTFYSPP